MNSLFAVKKPFLMLMTVSLLISGFDVFSQRPMEYLDRGVVALERERDIYITWRMLGTEPQDIGFNIYRNGTKINSDPITETTDFIDTEGSNSDNYSVSSVINGSESELSEEASVWGRKTGSSDDVKAYKTIPLPDPPQVGGVSYIAGDMCVGDLDGDGEYELVFEWEPNQDAHPFIEAIELDGTSLWRVDCGPNVTRQKTAMLVYDFDGDGKAELSAKTGPGTRDGTGEYLSTGSAASDDDSRVIERNSGNLLYDPAYITVFNGETGKEMGTVDYWPPLGPVETMAQTWGDDRGHRASSIKAAVLYIQDIGYCFVYCRGIYTRIGMAAYSWDGNQINELWKFDTQDPDNGDYWGEGNHSVSVGDVDGDGSDELMYGACAIDDDGTGLYSTGFGHGDADHLADHDPDHPGLEFFQPHENATYGISMRDAGTGEMLWEYRSESDVGRAWAADVDPNYRGSEISAIDFPNYDCKGEEIPTEYNPFWQPIYFDGDVQRELRDGEKINDGYGGGRIFTGYHFGAVTIHYTKKDANLVADILGDWREEVIYRNENNEELILLSTWLPTERKNYTLMHDPVYRMNIAVQSIGYNQPAHTGYYFPDGAPVPDIELVNGEPVEDCAGVLGGSAYIDNCGECVGGTTDKEPCEQDCNGDWGGDAYIDECGVCVAGESGFDPCAGAVQGEDASEFSGVIESTHDGYTGEGYLDYDYGEGVSAEWSICSDTAFTSTLTIRYSNGGSANRDLAVSVNGEEQISRLEIPVTSSWTEWDRVTAELDFQEGENLVSMAALSEEGGPNIDVITFPDEHLYGCTTGIKSDENILQRTGGIEYANGRLAFYLQQESKVDITVYNISGQKLMTLFDGKADQGYNSVQLNPSEFTAGMYIFVLKTGNSIMKKRVLRM